MQSSAKIAVVSRTFSQVPELVAEIQKYFSNVTLNPEQKLKGNELAAFIGEAEGALIALEPMGDDVLAKCPNLKIVSKFGVGLDNVDLEACKKRNVAVGWTGGTNKLSVAEMVVSFMIALSRNLFRTSLQLKQGVWNKEGGVQLTGRTVGIIGVGHVGKEVIKLLAPFGCKILVNDIVDQSDYYRTVGVESVTKEELFRRSHIITLHTPLTPETNHIINSGSISQMRPDVYILNTARGPLIDYAALKEALKTHRIAGAAIDVYDEEPPRDKELLALDTVFCTPHIGGNSKEAVLAMGMSAIEHLKRQFLT